jgi:hypothetical protein
VRRGIRAAERAAHDDLARRQAAEQTRQEGLAKTEEAFQAVLDTIVEGFSAVIALARTPQLRKLANARHAIGEPTFLYEAMTYEPETSISVNLLKGFVELVISGTRASSVQECGKSTRYVGCTLRRQFSINRPAAVDRAWFRHVLTADLLREWYEWEFESDFPHPLRRTSNDTLNHFSKLNALEMALPETLKAVAQSERDEFDGGIIGLFPGIEEPANLVLLRFLADCRNPEKLGRYLELAIVKLSAEEE